MDPFEYKEIFSAAYPQDLEPIVKLLGAYEIEGQIETSGTNFNPNFMLNRAPDAVKLFVRIEDYPRAREILVSKEILSDDDDDAGMRLMLGDLDDDELLEIVADANRQPPDQVAMARKLLEERGASTEPDVVQARTASMTSIERKPHTIKLWAKILWILVSLLIPPATVGAAIIVVAFTGKDTNGNSYWLYSKPDRLMFGVLGLAVGLIWIGASLYNARVMITFYDTFFW